MARRSNLTEQQWMDLVLQLLRRRTPGVRIARAAGVIEQTLYRWRGEFLRGELSAMNGSLSKSGVADELRRKEAQPAERDEVIGELTVANRILKKKSPKRRLSAELRAIIDKGCRESDTRVRLGELLKHLWVSRSSWYLKPG